MLIALAAFMHAAGTSSAERRVALVVGNSKYAAAGLELANPKNDSQDVATALRELGFEVVHKADATKRDFDTTLQNFARLSAGADSALFFYAGHAMQYQGRNYLVPIDAELDDEISIRYQTIALDDVRAALDQVTGVKVVILDACRNNPLANRLNRMMVGQNRAAAAVRGLARIDKTQGMVVAYATSADDVALDGEGRNSPFTGALVRRMQEPGLEIEMMFRRVAADVNSQTRGRQRPETYISLLNEYYLNQSDTLAWERIKDATDVAALRAFVAKFPASSRAPDAQHRIAVLERLAEERQAEQRESARRKAEQEAAQAREAQERARQDEAARARQQAEQEAKRREAAREAELEAEKQAKLAAERRLDAERRPDEERRRQAEQAKAAADESFAAGARIMAERESARIQAMAQSPDAVRKTELPAPSHDEAKPQTDDQAPFALASVHSDTVAPPPPKPGAIASDPILEIQLELARIGCFRGRASGVLDAATTSAVRNYLSHARSGLSGAAVDADLLRRLKTHEEPVCPIQCAKGQVADGDHCVAAREPPAPRRLKAAPAPKKPQVAARGSAAKVRREPPPVSAPPIQPAAAKPATSPARPIVGVGF